MNSEERITERLAKRKELVRSTLEKHDPFLLLLAEYIRSNMGGRMTYLKTPDVTLGTLQVGVPVGLMQIKPKARKKQ